MKNRSKGPVSGLILAVSTILLSSCGEDARFSSQTQYLGGVYGPGPVSAAAPQDNVSYWDGDDMSGKPSVKISLGEQRAYFYKGGQTGRDFTAFDWPRRVKYSHTDISRFSKRTRTTSRPNTAITLMRLTTS